MHSFARTSRPAALLFLSLVTLGCPGQPNPVMLTPPMLEVMPAASALGVPVNSGVRIQFSEAVETDVALEETFTLSVTRSGALIPGALSLEMGGTVLLFQPAAELPEDTELTARLSVDAWVDSEGASPAPNHSDGTYQWSFTTGAAPDRTAPRLIRTAPESGAGEIPLRSVIELEFSEPMDPASFGGMNLVVADLGLGGPVAGRTTCASVRCVFTPEFDLRESTVISVFVGEGVADLAGN
jgi:hypothetical protein